MPTALTNVIAISAGAFHSLALKADGTVAAWGAGTNSSDYPNFGQAIVPSMRRVIAVAAGGDHSVALQADGNVVVWGLDDSGETQVPAGVSNIVAIAAGGNDEGGHTLALRNDGRLFAWGSNFRGESDVPDGLTNIAAVAAGSSQNLVLRTDGAIDIWPADYSLAELEKVVSVSVNGDHWVALKADGGVIEAGGSVPHFARGLSNIISVAAGDGHRHGLGPGWEDLRVGR